MKTYRGKVKVGENGALLDAGGVEVRLEGDQELFEPFNGSFITIAGEQEGDIIRHAKPTLQSEATAINSSITTSFGPVIAAIMGHKDQILTIPGVTGIRPGFSRKSENISPIPVIVVTTDTNQRLGQIPAQVDGITVETRMTTALELPEEFLPISAWEGNSPEAVPQINYKAPDPKKLSLKEMKVQNITCHVGPDSGWTTLKPFLEGTNKSLTVAMYEFYANHIIETVASLGKETKATLDMILQVSPNDKEIKTTLQNSWGSRLNFVNAAVHGPNRIFNNAYHTKVAVRDSKAFWLSSGNWSPNSQPLNGPGTNQFMYKNGNREWHVIIEDAALAEMYEKYIKYDMDEARKVGQPESVPILPDLLIPESLLQLEATVVQKRPFIAKTFATSGEPVHVKPLMSPDNYVEEVLKLIQGAEHSLYLQFSYIRQPSTETFNDVITAISQKMEQGLDVRILVGNNQKPEHSDLLVGVRGWKQNMFRVQTSKLHNKGILIDGNIAVVGSNNWSSDGTQYNRDTSLVFYSRPIAQYYTEVFLFDWNNLSRPINNNQEFAPVLAPASGPTPLGMVRIPWQAWFNE